MARTFSGRWTRSAVCIAPDLGFRGSRLRWVSWVSGETSGKSMVWESTFLLNYPVKSDVDSDPSHPHFEMLWYCDTSQAYGHCRTFCSSMFDFYCYLACYLWAMYIGQMVRTVYRLISMWVNVTNSSNKLVAIHPVIPFHPTLPLSSCRVTAHCMNNECLCTINCGGGGGDGGEPLGISTAILDLHFRTSTIKRLLDSQCTYIFYFSSLFYISSPAFIHFLPLPSGLFLVPFGPDWPSYGTSTGSAMRILSEKTSVSIRNTGPLSVFHRTITVSAIQRPSRRFTERVPSLWNRPGMMGGSIQIRINGLYSRIGMWKDMVILFFFLKCATFLMGCF